METNDKPTKTETLNGGIDCIVTYADGGTETVFVRQLPVKLYPKLAQAQMEEETSLVMLYADKPLEWVEKLTPQAHETIISEGERINADFFWRWVERKMTRQEKLMPGIRGKLLEIAASTSRTSPPNSPSAAV